VLDTFRYQKLFQALLGNDYELLATDQPGEALLMAASQDPDLILLAQTQEETNGLMVAREIRETAASIAPIFLMLTADLPTLRREAQKAGCSGVLVKPIEPQKLRSLLKDWLTAKTA
jgi:CheY-like chemotaxis protein